MKTESVRRNIMKCLAALAVGLSVTSACGTESYVRLVKNWSDSGWRLPSDAKWQINGEGDDVSYNTAVQNYDSALLVFNGLVRNSIFNGGAGDWVLYGIEMPYGAALYPSGGDSCFAIGEGGITANDGSPISFNGSYENIPRPRIRLRASQAWTSVNGTKYGFDFSLGTAEKPYGYIVADSAATELRLVNKVNLTIFTDLNDLTPTAVSVCDNSKINFSCAYPDVATPVNAAKLNAAELVLSGPQALLTFSSDRSGESAADVIATKLTLDNGATFVQNGMIFDFDEVSVTGSGTSTIDGSGAFASKTIPLSVASGATLALSGTALPADYGFALSGGGNLTVGATASARLASVAVDYSGTITVDGGVLILRNSSMLGSGVIQTINGAKVGFEVPSADDANHVSDPASIVSIVGDTWPWSGDSCDVSSGTMILVTGDGLVAGKTLRLKGGVVQFLTSVTVGASIVQDISSTIMARGACRIDFAGAVNANTASAGVANTLTFTGDAGATYVLSGGGMFATATDNLAVVDGSVVFSSGTFLLGGEFTWSGGDLIVENNAVVSIAEQDGEGAQKNFKFTPSAEHAFEIRDAAVVTIGERRVFFLGTGLVKVHLRLKGGTLRLRSASSSDNFYVCSPRTDESNGCKKSSTVELLGGTLDSDRPIIRVTSGQDLTTTPCPAYFVASNGTWKVHPMKFGSGTTSTYALMGKNNQTQSGNLLFPLDVVGNWTLDISALGRGTLDNTCAWRDSEWTGRTGAGLTVSGPVQNNLTFVLSSFNPNGMDLTLTDNVKVSIASTLSGAQDFGALSVAANATLTVFTNVITCTSVAAGTDVRRLVGVDRVYRRVDDAREAMFLRMTDGAATDEIDLVPGADGVLDLTGDVGNVSGYVIPTVFGSAADPAGNFASWTVYVNGRQRKFIPQIVPVAGGSSLKLIPAKGFFLLFR